MEDFCPAVEVNQLTMMMMMITFLITDVHNGYLQTKYLGTTLVLGYINLRINKVGNSKR